MGTVLLNGARWPKVARRAYTRGSRKHTLISHTASARGPSQVEAQNFDRRCADEGEAIRVDRAHNKARRDNYRLASLG